MEVSAPIHPGEHLAEILAELDISQYRLANAIGVRSRPIPPLRIGQALAMTPEYWLNLQKLYDLDLARASADLGAIEQLVAAS